MIMKYFRQEEKIHLNFKYTRNWIEFILFFYKKNLLLKKFRANVIITIRLRKAYNIIS